MSNLDDRELRIARGVNQVAFVNPFSDDRQRFEKELTELVAPFASEKKGKALQAGLSGWIGQLAAGKQRLAGFHGEEAELMRVVFLYATYHRFAEKFDELIAEQDRQDAALPAAFGRECIRDLRAHGFSEAEAARFVGIFYQLRRAHHFIVEGLPGASPCMKQFRRRLWNNVFTSDVRWYDRYLWSRMEDFSTLLLGPTGAGKGTAAAAIGRSGYIPFNVKRGEFEESFRRTFISINLAQFPETLLEAELFGHRKGAFTGAVAAHDGVLACCSRNGAIFLDEIGEVSSTVQVKLLNVLQERTFSPVGTREKVRFNGRVISATNLSLEELQDDGRRFREDFFYRITSDVIEVPSLRERLKEAPEELDLLLDTILGRMTGEQALVNEVRDRLRRSPGPEYEWPGNVRELEQAVRRVLLTGEYEPRRLHQKAGSDSLRKFKEVEWTAEEALREYCREALKKYSTRAEVARRLRLDPRTVRKYLG